MNVIEAINLAAIVVVEEKDKSSRYIPVDDNTVCYGALQANLPNHRPETFYLSTAISYTNSYPHIGHAYESLSADTIVRYKRLFGFDTFFLTGTDEHGQKVAASVEKSGLTPIEHCNKFVAGFQALTQRLAVKSNRFIRTTDPVYCVTALHCCIAQLILSYIMHIRIMS